MKNVIVIIGYDPEAPSGQQIQCGLTGLGVGMLNTLTDFELKVFATEAGIVLRRALEMPPSPKGTDATLD